jgi:probable rRNA maturation factor
LVIFRKRVAGLSGTELSRFVAQAKRVLRLKGDVHVLVTSSREVRRLNRRFRAKDETTDVLSFPATASLPDGLAGDVAISAEIATKNARQLGHSTAEEVKILALHGVLHLAGYDHARDHGEMARKEQRLRESLGLPEGLIERSERRRSRAARDSITAEGIRSAPGSRKKSSAAKTIQ